MLIEVGQIFKAAVLQFISGGMTTTPKIYCTQNIHAKAKAWKLTEKDAEDVYYHGQEGKPNMMIRKFNGYEIGIHYFLAKQTAQPVITSIWKR